MMTESEVRKTIVQLVRPFVVSSGLVWNSNDLHVLDGLAWALTGTRPQHADIGHPHILHQYLSACGIPCDLEDHGSYKRVKVRPDWLTAHGLTLA